MFLPGLKVHYIGITPESKLHSQIFSYFVKIHSLSPSDAKLKVIFKPCKNQLKGEISIRSLSGNFESSIIESDLLSVAQGLSTKASEFVQNWRTHRSSTLETPALELSQLA